MAGWKLGLWPVSGSSRLGHSLYRESKRNKTLKKNASPTPSSVAHFASLILCSEGVLVPSRNYVHILIVAAPDIRNTARCADAPMIVRMEQRAIYTLQRIPGRDQERPEHR